MNSRDNFINQPKNSLVNPPHFYCSCHAAELQPHHYLGRPRPPAPTPPTPHRLRSSARGTGWRRGRRIPALVGSQGEPIISALAADNAACLLCAGLAPAPPRPWFREAGVAGGGRKGGEGGGGRRAALSAQAGWPHSSSSSADNAACACLLSARWPPPRPWFREVLSGSGVGLRQGFRPGGGAGAAERPQN